MRVGVGVEAVVARLNGFHETAGFHEAGVFEEDVQPEDGLFVWVGGDGFAAMLAADEVAPVGGDEVEGEVVEGVEGGEG